MNGAGGPQAGLTSEHRRVCSAPARHSCHPSSVVEQRFRKSPEGVTGSHGADGTIDRNCLDSPLERVTSATVDVTPGNAPTPRQDNPGQPPRTTGAGLSCRTTGLVDALEHALDEARKAGLWNVVATLAAQLSALPPENVIALDEKQRERT